MIILSAIFWTGLLGLLLGACVRMVRLNRIRIVEALRGR